MNHDLSCSYGTYHSCLRCTRLSEEREERASDYRQLVCSDNMREAILNSQTASLLLKISCLLRLHPRSLFIDLTVSCCAQSCCYHDHILPPLVHCVHYWYINHLLLMLTLLPSCCYGNCTKWVRLPGRQSVFGVAWYWHLRLSYQNMSILLPRQHHWARMWNSSTLILFILINHTWQLEHSTSKSVLSYMFVVSVL